MALVHTIDEEYDDVQKTSSGGFLTDLFTNPWKREQQRKVITLMKVKPGKDGKGKGQSPTSHARAAWNKWRRFNDDRQYERRLMGDIYHDGECGSGLSIEGSIESYDPYGDNDAGSYGSESEDEDDEDLDYGEN